MNFEVLFIVLIFVLGGLRRYRPSNALTCGQWGYIGTQFDIKNYLILGLYNQSRGVHSCGVYMNGQIVKGTGELKLFTDFIAASQFPTELDPKYRICLGHTRQASAGYNQHGPDQQHPFTIGGLIGQQNGTVSNAYDLGRKYDIPRNSWSVDTQLLYMILAEHGLDVLEEYDGAAALMWIEEKNPNKLFIFKGACESANPKETGLYTERPLYFLNEGTGIYFSSMENSLQAIQSDPDHELSTVPHNKVMSLEINDAGDIKVETIRQIARKRENFYHAPKSYMSSGNVQARQLTAGRQNGMNTFDNVMAMNTTQNTGGTANARVRKTHKKSEFNSRVITPE